MRVQLREHELQEASASAKQLPTPREKQLHGHAPTPKLTRGIMRQRASSTPESPRGCCAPPGDAERRRGSHGPASGKEPRSVGFRTSANRPSRGGPPAPAGDANRFTMVPARNSSMPLARRRAHHAPRPSTAFVFFAGGADPGDVDRAVAEQLAPTACVPLCLAGAPLQNLRAPPEPCAV